MGCEIYKKIDKNQLTLEEFNIPFGNRLSAGNRWVKMAKIMPWELIEELYTKSFSESEGRPPMAEHALGPSYLQLCSINIRPLYRQSS